jgi:hypothetical protein
MNTYNANVFSKLHCSMQLGAPAELLAYVYSIEKFDEPALSDIFLKLHRCPSSYETQVLQHVVAHYQGEARLATVLMSAAMKRATEIC